MSCRNFMVNIPNRIASCPLRGHLDTDNETAVTAPITVTALTPSGFLDWQLSVPDRVGDAHENVANPSPCGSSSVFLVTPARNLSSCSRSSWWPDLTDSTSLTHLRFLPSAPAALIVYQFPSFLYQSLTFAQTFSLLKFILCTIAGVIFSDRRSHDTLLKPLQLPSGENQDSLGWLIQPLPKCSCPVPSPARNPMLQWRHCSPWLEGSIRLHYCSGFPIMVCFSVYILYLCYQLFQTLCPSVGGWWQNCVSRDFPGGPVVDSALPTQEAWSQSLVGELKSCMPHSMTKTFPPKTKPPKTSKQKANPE